MNMTMKQRQKLEKEYSHTSPMISPLPAMF